MYTFQTTFLVKIVTPFTGKILFAEYTNEKAEAKSVLAKRIE